MAQNTNTLLNKYSRYVAGGTTEVAEGKVEWWERAVFPPSETDMIYTIDAINAGRPDLIAYTFFNEPRYWWVIAQYNSIIDPIAEMAEGFIIRIPSKENLSLMLLEKQGGYASQREPVNTISPSIV